MESHSVYAVNHEEILGNFPPARSCRRLDNSNRSEEWLLTFP